MYICTDTRYYVKYLLFPQQAPPPCDNLIHSIVDEDQVGVDGSARFEISANEFPTK